MYKFRLSKTKDGNRETIVEISLVVAPKQWSYVALREGFKDDRCHDGQRQPVILFYQKNDARLPHSVCCHNLPLQTSR